MSAVRRPALLWLGGWTRWGRWPHSDAYRLLFDLGPLRLVVGRKPEGREGMVIVYNSITGEYLGCMGAQRWRRLLVEDGPRCDVWDEGAAGKEGRA